MSEPAEPAALPDEHLDRLSAEELRASLRETRRLLAECRSGRIAELQGAARERDEAYARQTAIATILEVIGQHPDDLQAVLDAIVENAARLTASEQALVNLVQETGLVNVADWSDYELPAGRQLPTLRGAVTPRSGDNVVADALADRRTVALHGGADAIARAYPRSAAVWQRFAERTGAVIGSSIAVPLVKGEGALGVLLVRRIAPEPYSDQQIRLLETFAAQAVIALENTRQFTEQEQRNHQVTEALEHQTATAEILRVISRLPGNLEESLQAIADAAMRLCHAEGSRVRLVEGDELVNGPGAGRFGDTDMRPTGQRAPRSVLSGPSSGPAAILRSGRTQHIPDVQLIAPAHVDPERAAFTARTGLRTVLGVPLLRDDNALGLLTLGRFDAVNPFSPQEIALAETFAAQAVIAVENARLFNELQESNASLRDALEQQTATAEILRVISRSPENLEESLHAVADAAYRLCHAGGSRVWLLDGDELVAGPGAGRNGGNADDLAGVRTSLTAVGALAETTRTGRAIHIEDLLRDADARGQTAEVMARVLRQGLRTQLNVPLLAGRSSVGVLTAFRFDEVNPFSRQEIALAETFANQAVIAIENARLFNELHEALERQTASAEILQAISTSPTEPTTALDLITDSARRLVHADNATLNEVRGDQLMTIGRAVTTGVLVAAGREIGPNWGPGRAVLERRTLHLPDLVAALQEFPEDNVLVRAGRRAGLFVPLLHEGRARGLFALWRDEARAFTADEIALAETFAQQAMIALENARLYGELDARNHDLSEALEQQTAIAEILRVISHAPGNLDRALQAIAETAKRLCHGDGSRVFLLEGGDFVAGPGAGLPQFANSGTGLRMPLDRSTPVGDAIRTGKTVHTEDMLRYAEESGAPAEDIAGLRQMGIRTGLDVPLAQGDACVGVLGLRRLGEISPFTRQEIALAETFAAQAVIAIENARLYSELANRNKELAEGLERQTASAEILQAISTSPTDPTRALDLITDSARRLVHADNALFLARDGDYLTTVGQAQTAGPIGDVRRFPISPQHHLGPAMLERRTLHLPDQLAALAEFPSLVRPIEAGRRTGLFIPLLHEDRAIGVFALSRMEQRAFAVDEIALAETFAQQAAIAIENARLYAELREALERQTASAQILQAISASPTDPMRALHLVAESAKQFAHADNAVLRGVQGERTVVLGLSAGAVSPMGDQPLSRSGLHSLAILERRSLHFPDLAAVQDEYPGIQEMVAQGMHAGLWVPLLHEGRAVGSLGIRRAEQRPFSDDEVALIETFASQAAIAMENARLYNELESRNHDLSEALEQQTATGEILQAMSKSPTDLPKVLQVVVERAARLIGTTTALVRVVDDQALRTIASIGQTSGATLGTPTGVLTSTDPQRLQIMLQHGHAQYFGSPDEIAAEQPEQAELWRRAGFERRTQLEVPLKREGELIGVLSVARPDGVPFTDQQIALLESFADQAVIAIENTRLFEDNEQKRRELEDLNQQLQEANRHKSLFVANMSHELRTPLNAVIGYSEMLHEECEDLGYDDLIPDLDKIAASGKHLLSLINNILDLSKIEAGKMELVLSDFDVAALVHEVEAVAQPLVARNENTLSVALADDVGTMYADEAKVRQTLLNLLSNAAKFTEHGAISVVARREQQDGADWLSFAVQDTGIGMTAAQLGKLFSAFSQAEATTASTYGGTGLGLALSRTFCHMLCGDISVTSEPGAGSTFTVRLPAAAHEA